MTSINETQPGDYDVRLGDQLLAQGDVEFFLPPDEVTVDELRKYRGTLAKEVRDMEPGQFLLDAMQFEELFDHSTHGELYKVDKFGAGRHQNGHGVVFGQLILNSNFERDRQVFVAVKPFDTPKDALKEFLATMYINGFGRPSNDEDPHGGDNSSRRTLTYNPLGFHRFADNGQFGLVTEFDETVKSFDNIFWDPEKPPTEQQVARALARAAFGLARLHVIGVSHGDSSVKNMAADNIGIRYVDLESIRPFPRSGKDIDEHRAKMEMTRDLEIFMGSLNSGIEDEPVDYSDAARTAFNEHYIAAMKHPSAASLGNARLSKKDIDRIIEQEI